MTTVADIITRALRPMRDTSQEYFVDAELIEYINDAVRDLSSRERLIREVSSVNTSGGALTLPTLALQVRWVQNPDGVEVVWLDESTFFIYQKEEPDWSEDNPLATIYDDKVWLHPAPADGVAWSVGFYGIPTALTAAANTFPLREVHEGRVVHYVRGQCYYRLGEIELADREIAAYNMGLRPAEAIADHQVPGRLAFSREANAFDSDPDSVHRGK